MRNQKHNVVSADKMKEIFVQVQELSDELVLIRKWPCFRQRRAEVDAEGKEKTPGRPSCIMFYPRDMREEMCATCQLLAAVQDVEREMKQEIRVQQMVEAGRLTSG